MCCSLFKTGEQVKLANGNPISGIVTDETEPFNDIHILDQSVLVVWTEAIPSGFGYLTICQYYHPDELIRPEIKKH